VEAVGSRIPIGQGLAGFVAATGTPLNISDAYRDSRFDRTFDVATGFRTRSVLVWPISLATTVPSTTPGAPPSSTSSVIAVLQAINKRSTSMMRVASNNLLRSRSRVGSLFSTPTAADGTRAVGPAASRLASTRHSTGGGGAGGSAATSARSVGHTQRRLGSTSGQAVAGSEVVQVSPADVTYIRFDAADERAMGAFCSEVAIALKRRSVEAAFMKVLADSPSAVPDEFNVSLLALYSDAGTSARLHTSVLVRRVSVERSVSWPPGLLAMRNRGEGAPTAEDALNATARGSGPADAPAGDGDGAAPAASDVAPGPAGPASPVPKAGAAPDTAVLSPIRFSESAALAAAGAAKSVGLRTVSGRVGARRTRE
jgi:hypothetical protein